MLDVLALRSAQMGHKTGLKAASVPCEIPPLTTVSIGLALEGILGLSVDNYSDMHDIVAHLIEVRGHHRIASIKGNRAQHRDAGAVPRLRAPLSRLP